MKTLDEIRVELSDRNLRAVSARAGVHYNALLRLMNRSSNPSYETVRKVSDYLEGKPCS